MVWNNNYYVFKAALNRNSELKTVIHVGQFNALKQTDKNKKKKTRTSRALM